MSSKTIRWGIVGAGAISARFVKDLTILHNNPQGPSKVKHIIAAIASSNKEKGQQFVELFIPGTELWKHETKVCSYDEVINDKDVDVLYIGLPHVFHAGFVIQAIKQGKKNILCEKPVTMNSKELEQILDVALENKVFFMEAMWVRFFPAFLELQDRIYGSEAIIGNVKRVRSNYSLNMNGFGDLIPEHRIINKKLGGGALLDIGIYSVTYSRLFLHPDSNPLEDWEIVSQQTFDSLTGKAEDEVDFITTVLFNNSKHKQQGISSSSIHNATNGPLVIIEGEKGKVIVNAVGTTPSPENYRIELKNGEVFEKSFVEELMGSEGFLYQATEVGEAIVNSEKQSKIISWDESLVIMRILDKIREQNGLIYAQDL